MIAEGGTTNGVLIVANAQQAYAAIANALPPLRFWPVSWRETASEARQLADETPPPIAFIHAPLSDESGVQLALDLTGRLSCVALLVPEEAYERVCARTEPNGVLTLARPCSERLLRQTAGLLAAARARLLSLERRTVTLEDKVDEIRLVNRAKWLLIERRGMDEAAAHRYIEKLAMDSRQTRKVVAQTLIRSLDAD